MHAALRAAQAVGVELIRRHLDLAPGAGDQALEAALRVLEACSFSSAMNTGEGSHFLEAINAPTPRDRIPSKTGQNALEL